MRPALNSASWLSLTALVTVSATTGQVVDFSFVPSADAAATSPSAITQLALRQAATRPSRSDEESLRHAIVNVAEYFMHMANEKSPAEMEAIIWQHDSLDGVDHGRSCAAFASLTLELASQVVGQQSWVTGGISYPWPLHKWADVRVDPNPQSMGITSIVQDATAHHRWHPLGDGYSPKPGDWVLFDEHVEVVTSYRDGVLHTIGGDSLPNFSVNPQEYTGSFAQNGVAGFVNNGNLKGSPTANRHPHGDRSHQGTAPAAPSQAAIPGAPAPGAVTAPNPSGKALGDADIPGPAPSVPPTPAVAPGHHGHGTTPRRRRREPQDMGQAAIPGSQVVAPASSRTSPVIPGATSPPAGHFHGYHPRPPRIRHHPHPAPPSNPAPSSITAFIKELAPGAIRGAMKTRVPASVTIAQGIWESGAETDAGPSQLARLYNNPFGMKPISGYPQTPPLPTWEVVHGVDTPERLPFAAFPTISDALVAHANLIAYSGYYGKAMATVAGGGPITPHVADEFAKALTGVYATDTDYGHHLISMMRQYGLYRYDRIATSDPAPPVLRPSPSPSPTPPAPSGTQSPTPRPTPRPSPSGASPTPAASWSPTPTPSPSPGSAQIPGELAVTSAGLQVTSARQMAIAPAVRPVSVRRRYFDARSIPHSVGQTYITRVGPKLYRHLGLYQGIAEEWGIPWQLLAAADYMQCEGDPRRSPVHGEKLGSVNIDGAVYPTREDAMDQCAQDLIVLARSVYGIELQSSSALSITELAETFAAFRYGRLLVDAGFPAMLFAYSVMGLTPQHVRIDRWPLIDNALERPGRLLNRPVGALVVVVRNDYKATDD